MKKSKIILIVFILGLIYIKAITVDIYFKKDGNLIIYSNIPQNINLHIKTEYKKSKLWCNGRAIKINSNKKHDYFYRGEEEITLHLNIGENSCIEEYIDKDIRQKPNIIDFLLICILIIIPISLILFSMLIYILDKIDLDFKESNIDIYSSSKLIYIIVSIGILIRILYFNKYGIMLFQHDWQGHIDLIRYLAQNHTLPYMPNRGWEYPQQPLYYIITASIYRIFLYLGYSSKEALHYGVGSFSLISSSIFLIYSAKLLNYLTSNSWVKIVAMLFLTLTPSLVYMSARVNNDTLVISLSVIAIYYIVKSYREDFKNGFYIALTTTTLLFLTKLSTAPIELLLFTLLIISYIKTKYIKRELLIFSLVGLFILSWTLWHLYAPLSGGFYMVNSAKFPKQTIEHLDSSYFLSFHISNLISQGYSFVFGDNSVRYSLPTYQYGTMFFGEFDYRYFLNKTPYLLTIMRIILISGLIYIVGLFSYIVHLKKETILNRLMFTVVVINLILILKFIISYPSICNSDFRYFVSSFTIIGYIFAQGLYYIMSYHKYIKYIISSILLLLIICELIFFYSLYN